MLRTNPSRELSSTSAVMEDQTIQSSRVRKRNKDYPDVDPDMGRDGSPSGSLSSGPAPVLEVVGKHALLFDDDSTAAFIDSQDALVPWNGDQTLIIDRYDVRHLLQDLSGLRKRRPYYSSDTSEADLDFERYRDLRDPSPEHDASKRQKLTGDGYQSVPFSYGSEETATEEKKSEEAMESYNFNPPFSVPENLLSHLPPTEKTHQIIARTAKFVSEHGGQSEIILRVKQGNNPVFGFLMPDHNFHIYFRFLVDHPEVLDADKKADLECSTKNNMAGEGLSLLGSTYGTGDEEDEGTIHLSGDAKEGESADPVDDSAFGADSGNCLERAESSAQMDFQKDSCSAEPHATSNLDATVNENNSSILEDSKCTSGDISETDNSHKTAKNGSQSMQASEEKLKESVTILEPPLFLKSVVLKMVEFIVRNGKEFEGIIVNQDRSTGRFPFLLPSNQYHPYYLKVLGEAQQGKLPEIDQRVEKFISSTDVRVNEVQKQNKSKKKNSVTGDGSSQTKSNNLAGDGSSQKKNNNLAGDGRGSTPEEMKMTQAKGTLDPEKRAKFKIVIGGIKKDGNDHGTGKPPGMTAEAAASAVRAAIKGPGNFRGFSQANAKEDSEKRESGMSADAAAAIVMAATRGARRSQQGGASESGTVNAGLLEKILRGISEESDGISSAGLSSSHGDVSNPHSSNDGMPLPQSGHHPGVSGSSSKQITDVCLPQQQSGNVSGASGSILRLDDPNITDDTSVAKVMVKAAALAASCEADSSEACLSREQKVKAERLKRAKMFAAMIKSGHHVLEEKNVQPPPESAVSFQNESVGKVTVCGSSYDGASIQPDSPKGRTSDESAKGEEYGQAKLIPASEEHGHKSVTRHPERGRHSHRHRSDHHKRSRSKYEKSDNNSDDGESRERRHKHDYEKNHKDSISERHSRKRHESNSLRSSDDGHRRHTHRSCSRDRDSGNRHHSNSRDRDSTKRRHRSCSRDKVSSKRHDNNDSKEGERHRSKETDALKHTKKSSGKEHAKEFSCGKEHSYKDKKKERVALNLSTDKEGLPPKAPKSPAHTTEAPNDLRAKVRAMLLATL